MKQLSCSKKTQSDNFSKKLILCQWMSFLDENWFQLESNPLRRCLSQRVRYHERQFNATVSREELSCQEMFVGFSFTSQWSGFPSNDDWRSNEGFFLLLGNLLIFLISSIVFGFFRPPLSWERASWLFVWSICGFHPLFRPLHFADYSIHQFELKVW